MANTTIPVELSSTPGIVDNSNATAITIDSSENVGIGTGSPSTALHVDSLTAAKAVIIARTTTSEAINLSEMQDYNALQILNKTSGSYLNFAGNASNSQIQAQSDASTAEDIALNPYGGNVGIGTTSPSEKLEIAGAASSSSTGIAIKNGSATRLRIYHNDNAGTNYINSYDVQAAQTLFILSGNNLLLSGGGGTEHARIDSSGRLLHGTTAAIGIGKVAIKFNGQNSVGLDIQTTATDGYLQRFYDSGGTAQGHIYVATNGTVSFSNLSDYRAKENVVTDWDATTRLKQLKPSRFNFIADSTNTTVDGFLAHEVQDIVPEAITGVKDAVDSEGNPKYQGIDQSKLVPLLTKAIQEQQALIESLTARITTLEG